MSPIQSNTQEGLVVKPSAVDLSAKIGYFAKIDASGNAALAGDGGFAQFIIEDCKSSDVGADTTLRPLTVNRNVRVISAGVITAGDFISSDASAKANTAASGDYILGVAEESAVAAQYVLIRPCVSGAKIP